MSYIYIYVYENIDTYRKRCAVPLLRRSTTHASVQHGITLFANLIILICNRMLVVINIKLVFVAMGAQLCCYRNTMMIADYYGTTSKSLVNVHHCHIV